MKKQKKSIAKLCVVAYAVFSLLLAFVPIVPNYIYPTFPKLPCCEDIA